MPSIGIEGKASSQLLRGLASAQSEATGWNAAVQPLLTSADLFRRDAHTVVLTLPQRANYDVDAPETLSLTIPQSALYVCEDDLPPAGPNGTLSLIHISEPTRPY